MPSDLSLPLRPDVGAEPSTNELPIAAPLLALKTVRCSGGRTACKWRRGTNACGATHLPELRLD